MERMNLDLQALREYFVSTGFAAALPGTEILRAQGGEAILRLPVSENVRNPLGTLHGGAIATLVDNAGTLAIISADEQGRGGVTSDLHVSYFRAGRGADVVLARASVLKCGHSMAFIVCDIVRESDGVLLAQGRMSKHLGH